MKIAKKSIYFLIPILLFVWGLLGYKIYNTFFSKKNYNPTIHLSEQRVMGENGTSRYITEMNYPDPFLKSRKKSASKDPVKIEIIDSVITAPKAKLMVEFVGFISSVKNTDKQAVVRINDSLYIVAIGDSISFYKVVNISMDTLSISNGKDIWMYGYNP